MYLNKRFSLEDCAPLMCWSVGIISLYLVAKCASVMCVGAISMACMWPNILTVVCTVYSGIGIIVSKHGLNVAIEI